MMAARLSQIDYDREMALIATGITGGPSAGEMMGVARFVANPEFDKAEFAIMVRSDLKGQGIGFALMKELIGYARRRGLQTLYGEVLRENHTMLRLADELGFVRSDTAARDVVRLTLSLAAAPDIGPA
jgi:acetyltransferase